MIWKYNIGVFAMVICAMATLAGSVNAEQIYVKGKKARFRAGPGTNYSILWESSKYTPLEYLARYKNWYAVRDKDGDVAWVSEQVIATGATCIVINKKANIRRGPGTNTGVAFAVEEGYLFQIIDKKGEWYKVKDAEGDQGWIFSNLVWVSK